VSLPKSFVGEDSFHLDAVELPLGVPLDRAERDVADVSM
jgi:hypothetical protein